MDNGKELIDALLQVSREKGIDKEIIFEAIEASLVSACKKQFPNAAISVRVDRETGGYKVYAQKTVTEDVTDPNAEISLADARSINQQLNLGDVIDLPVTPNNFGRIAAQTAKQVVVQKFREAEREMLYNEFIKKEHQLVTGIVQRRDRRNVIVALGRMDAVLTPAEQLPREPYNFQDRVKLYVQEVKQSSKGPMVTVSRAHPELVRRLFEQEVPEVYDGLVEIKSIAREPGSRTKIAVYSPNPNIDPIGSCVGQNGYRVNIISQELRGEKIDIIQYSSDPVAFIAAALSPSKVVTVAINKEEKEARVIVPDTQLSLAIGREGQNARLAAKLTNWRIDIKSESQAKDTDFLVFPDKAYEDEYYNEDEYEYDDDYDDVEYEYEEEDGSEDGEYEEYYGDGEYYDEEYEYDDAENKEQ